MLTFEKVIEIFADYLAQDQELEVCKSRYGYIRVEFSGMEGPEDFCSGEVCHTPEQLFDLLLSDYQGYAEIQLTRGRRDATVEDYAKIAVLSQHFLDLRKEAEKPALTNDTVLAVFASYLEQDPNYEVVWTSHGYAVMAWDNCREYWYATDLCQTPEELRDMLINAYEDYLGYALVAEEERDLTEQEKEEIRQKCQTMYDRCMEVET